MEKTLNAVKQRHDLSHEGSPRVRLSRRPGQFLNSLGEETHGKWEGTVLEWYNGLARVFQRDTPTDLFIGRDFGILLQHSMEFVPLTIQNQKKSGSHYTLIGKLKETYVWVHEEHPAEEAWSFMPDVGSLVFTAKIHGFEKQVEPSIALFAEIAMKSYKTDDKNWYAPRIPFSDNTTRIKFLKTSETAKLPSASRDGDIGFDVYADEDFSISPGDTKKISTGITLADMPLKDSTGNRIFLKVEGRSGLASKGIFPIGGIIDPTYRGEISIVLTYNKSQNTPRVDVKPFNKGDRIAQLVVYKVATAGEVIMEESQDVTKTNRGACGFGSSGK